jgi:pyridoxine 5-phosphate synthase
VHGAQKQLERAAHRDVAAPSIMPAMPPRTRSRPRLSVNLNKVALLRNQRDLPIPSVIRAAQVCIRSGAHGITVHPRPDERHIRKSDVVELGRVLDDIELNIEGNPFDGFLGLVRQVQPAQCTLVPDDPGQATSDHGWRLREGGGPTKGAERLRPIVRELRQLGIRVSLFIDPDLEQITAAAELEPDRIELYTEPYARAYRTPREAEVVAQYAQAALHANALGLGVNAGHDLSLENLLRFCEGVPGVLEVSIGHALIADALFMGLTGAVRAYREVAGWPRA